MTATADDPLGLKKVTINGKYVVESLLGQGGAAAVYSAKRVPGGESVAIKFFLNFEESAEKAREQLIGDFAQEGELLTRLSAQSPAIVRSYEMGTYQGSGGYYPYLVLEKLEGAPLDLAIVEESEKGIPPRSLEKTVKLLDSAARGLALAHREGVVHRDIKPENMFIVGDPNGPNPLVKILDFGIAKVMQGGVRQFLQTAANVTPFTPHYGAPEQFSRGYGSTGPWTDVYAFALVILEVMRGGQRVFVGDDYLQLSLQSRSEDIRPTPRVIGLKVSDEVDSVFARALALRPEGRYDSMGTFWDALNHAINAKAPTSVPTSFKTKDSSAMAPIGVRTPSKLPAILIAIGGLGMLGAAGFKVYQNRASWFGGAAPSSSSAPPPAPTRTAAPSGSAPASVTAPAEPPSSAVSAVPPGAGPCGSDQVHVPGGRFDMGSPDGNSAGDPSRGPEHSVFLDGFCLDRTEVTTDTYRECVTAKGCKAPAGAISEIDAGGNAHPSEALAKLCNFDESDRGKHPINCVTFDEASAYCGWKKCRLPTEAEWEYAARNGQSKYPWGDDPPATRALLTGTDGFTGTAPVGSFPSGANKRGLLDMSGNVSEWIGDYFAPYPAGEQVNPGGPKTGDKRVRRGGSFVSKAPMLEVTARESAMPDVRSPAVGFRCASSPSGG